MEEIIGNRNSGRCFLHSVIQYNEIFPRIRELYRYQFYRFTSKKIINLDSLHQEDHLLRNASGHFCRVSRDDIYAMIVEEVGDDMR